MRKPFYGPPSTSGAPVTEADAQLTLNLVSSVETPFTVPLVNTIGKVISSNITVNGKPFVTWFNTDFRSRMPKTHPTVKIGGALAPVFPSTIGAAPFKDAYDNCSRILAPQMTIEECIGTFCIIYNEAGGTFKPVSERGSLRYFFEPDPKRHKASYNGGGNKKAGDQLLAQGAISSVRSLPGSGVRNAIEYMGHMWNEGLLRFLDDPNVPIDNNGTERCLRGVVIGRKNHYGSRSQRGTEVAALFYRMIESAKLAGVGPNTYLRAATMAALRGEPVPLPHQLA